MSVLNGILLAEAHQVRLGCHLRLWLRILGNLTQCLCEWQMSLRVFPHWMTLGGLGCIECKTRHISSWVFCFSAIISVENWRLSWVADLSSLKSLKAFCVNGLVALTAIRPLVVMLFPLRLIACATPDQYQVGHALPTLIGFRVMKASTYPTAALHILVKEAGRQDR